jgi:hypothetical protein
MLRPTKSDDRDPCEECSGLVGAGSAQLPHIGLFRLATSTRSFYPCCKCGVGWRMSKLGWARVVKSVNR